MLYIRLIIYAALSVGLAALNLKGIISYAYADFKDFVASLIAISGMVFTIMGIWIAFLYPNAVARIAADNIKAADFTEGNQDAKRLEQIVAAVLLSALVGVACAFLFLGKMIFGGISFYSENLLEIKSLSLGLITLLAMIQFEAILSVVSANVLFLVDLHRKREKRIQDESY